MGSQTYRALVLNTSTSTGEQKNDLHKAHFQSLPHVSNPLPSHSVRVRIEYASINPMDGKIMQIGNIFKLPEPVVLGFDFSGTIMEVSSDTASEGIFHVGDTVYGH